MNKDVVYRTGKAVIDGQDKYLIGGLWRLHRQEGFTFDLGVLHVVQELNALPDLCEAMAEACIYNELPQLVMHRPDLFTDEVKLKFTTLLAVLCKQHSLTQEEAFKFILNAKRSGKDAHVVEG